MTSIKTSIFYGDSLGFAMNPTHSLVCRIAPGEIQFVTVSFTPSAANSFNQKLALRIVDNPNRF